MSSRRLTARCLRASTEKDSTTGGSAAVRDFDPAYDRYGSSATGRYASGGRAMSASPQKRTSERLLRFVRFVPITTKIHSSKQCAIRSLVQRWCGPVDGSKLLRLAGKAGHGAPTCAFFAGFGSKLPKRRERQGQV